jgi:hypothetical protein
MRVDLFVWTFLTVLSVGAAQAQPVGTCDKTKADALRAKYPPEKVAALCGASQPASTPSAKCVTHTAVCTMSAPAPVGTPCYCTGPHGPDPGTIAP